MPTYRKSKRATAKSRRPRRRIVRRPIRSRRMAPAGVKGGFTLVRKVADMSLGVNDSSNPVFISTNLGGASPPLGWTIGTPAPVANFTSLVDVPFGMSFQLKDLVNYTDLTQISDKYKINKIWVRFFFNSQASLTPTYDSTTPQLNYPVPMIEYIQDHDDAVPPTIATFRERMGVKLKMPRNNGYIQVALNPSMLITDAVGTNVIKFGQYLDTAAPTVPHYGLKGVFKNVPNDVPRSLCRIDVAYSVSVKNLE